MEINEQWKDIKNASGYQVSNLGRVRSLDRIVKYDNGREHKRKGKILVPNTNRCGYQILGIVVNGKRTTHYVHRLVAEAFLENKSNYPQVNHKDENKLNNNVNNLEWCTAKYNCNYGSFVEKVIKRSNKKIIGINISNGYIAEFDSLTKASRNGFSISGISNVIHGRKSNHKGYRWLLND